ncbi:MAG: PDZ domain-containing protein [Sphingobacteriales bacterium]|nr:MAG: PDZ domain-containing protein [Sphingobacteriales bacterium]
MKRYFLQGLVVAGALVALPAFAQTTKTKDKDKEIQTIVITRDGNIDGKTVIEIKGNQVLVNGKEADKSPDVNVNVTTVKRGGHVSINGIGGRNTWVYNNDDFNVFTEDENRAMLGVVTNLVEKGAQISSVTKGSAAEKAGLKKDDIITRIDTVTINEDGDVSRAIRSRKPGDKVKVTFTRDGKEQNVTAELTAWKGLEALSVRVPSFHMDMPMAPSAPTPPSTYYFRNSDRPRLGVSVQDTEEGKGVKVTDVDEDTPAGKAGIQTNDIITKVDEEAINGTDDLRRITQRARQGSTFNLTLLRGGKEQKVEVKFPRKLKSADL